jgi:tRNA pseudouridine55 synthase
MFGLLNLNKPAGVTSRQVVDVVERLVRPARAGHAGTLDPLATGVLLVCVGQATRLIDYLHRLPKTYVATFLLGRSSPTEDIDGPVTELPNAPAPEPAQIEAAVQKFVGRIQQRPPAYSAVRLGGRRAYELARKGHQPELERREVEVYRMEVRSYAYPELTLEIQCSSGTYVRSLGRDLAESLGTAAVMSALVRTSIGQFRIEDALPPERLNADSISQHLLPAADAVSMLPRVELTDEEIARLRNGLAIAKPDAPQAEEIAGLDAKGRLVALLATAAPRVLRPLRNFAANQ